MLNYSACLHIYLYMYAILFVFVFVFYFFAQKTAGDLIILFFTVERPQQNEVGIN